MSDLLKVCPNDVHIKVPSRLVVGMASCQLSRVQIWLEHFLTPLSKHYGNFEYIKDSGEFLLNLENIKVKALNEQWDWEGMVLFSVDVKALYPSVKFEYLVLALRHCFDKCTPWTDDIKEILIDIIMYTLRNQQVYWDNKYFMLNQGIPTGGKHSVPIANIFLTFVFLSSLQNNDGLKQYFIGNIMLWKRFIDDCFGIFNEQWDW